MKYDIDKIMEMLDWGGLERGAPRIRALPLRDVHMGNNLTNNSTFEIWLIVLLLAAAATVFVIAYAKKQTYSCELSFDEALAAVRNKAHAYYPRLYIDEFCDIWRKYPSGYVASFKPRNRFVLHYKDYAFGSFNSVVVFRGKLSPEGGKTVLRGGFGLSDRQRAKLLIMEIFLLITFSIAISAGRENALTLAAVLLASNMVTIGLIHGFLFGVARRLKTKERLRELICSIGFEPQRG